jgi:hypothetical protein
VELTGAKRDVDDIAYQAAFRLSLPRPQHVQFVTIGQANAATSMRQKPDDVPRHGDGVLSRWRVLRSELMKLDLRHDCLPAGQKDRPWDMEMHTAYPSAAAKTPPFRTGFDVLNELGFSFLCRSHQDRLPRQRLRRPTLAPDLPDLAGAEPAPEDAPAAAGSRPAAASWFPDPVRDPGSVGRQSCRFSLLVTGDEAASETGVPTAELHDNVEQL